MKTIVLVTICIALIVYLSISFVELELNPLHWIAHMRATFVGITIISSVLFNLLVGAEKEYRKK